MSSAVGSLPPPSTENDAPLEVEEAELSSDSENNHSASKPTSRPSSPQDDFILDDEVDADDDDDDDDNLNGDNDSNSNHHSAPLHPQTNSHHPTLDPASAHNSVSGPNVKSEVNGATSPGSKPSSGGDSDESDYSSPASSEPDDDRDADHNPEEDEESLDEDDDVDSADGERNAAKMNDDDVQLNGHAGESDSDDPSNVIRRHPTRRRARKPDRFVIPDELKDNDEYFRRSSRMRSAPDRYSESPPDSPSLADSDSDFKAEDGRGDDEEDEEYEELDDDYSASIRRKPRGSRSGQRAGSGLGSRGQTEELHDSVAEDDDYESGSDGDWREDPKKKLLGRRRRRRGRGVAPAKRQRTSPIEDEEVARTARINNRTGGAVNYFEGDDDELMDSDEQMGAQGGAEAEVDDGLPRIETILDYRLPEDADPPDNSNLPFADFDQNKVEYHVKWLNKCHRRATWETWAVLKDMKGHKKVRNYIKLVQDKQAYLRGRVAAEEIEETKILIEEHRASTKLFEVIDRVIAQRETEEEPSQTEYLVKWKNLSYAECTWEPRADLASEADIKAIDEYTDREQSALGNSGKKRYNPFNVKEDRPRFKRMLEQPEYLDGEGRKLRDYQLAGLNFLAFSWTKRNNVILADEMGLGKTLQTISFLGWLMYCRHVQGPFLVVVPLSTIAAWVREFARWLPDMNVVCYVGEGKARDMIRQHEFWSSSKSTLKFHVLLTTPELLMADQDFLIDIKWAMIAVDEAHRLKNETSALHQTLASLRSADRLLVTGTPLQNSVRELWALLHFLNPEVFDNAESFEESFSFTALRDPERVSALHKTLRPYIIRRQKTDVEKSLPKKTYAVLRVGMTSSQQQYYRWLLTKNFAKLNAGGISRGTGATATLRNLLMELKKCCNHLYLFPNYEDTSRDTTVEELIRASGKMILLDKLLLRLREKGHRVLIFSQMVRMLDILQDYCRMRQFPCQRLDGSVHNEVRQRAVDHFNAPDSNDYVFLLSTRAGGLGINLATADTVIIFDSDWNPQNDLQAESRAHRIGQKKDVKVFRLLSRETVEEDILERAKRKRVLEHLVIHGVEGGDQADGKDAKMAFKKEELSAILRFGAEKLFGSDKTMPGNTDEKESEVNDVKPNGSAANNAPDEVPAQENKDNDKDEHAEERRVLEVDDIDELLARAPTDEASQIGAAQPSVGDSLLNAFKWADFKTVEEEEEEEDESAANDAMAKDAANRLVAIDEEASKAKLQEEKEKEQFSKEGDAEFWGRVIPGEYKEEALANEMVLGTRRRKRTKTFSAESPRDGKRRRVTRAARGMAMKISDVSELSEKEQRSLLRSLRKFGDPKLVTVILRDAGLHDRVEEDLAGALLLDTLEVATAAVKSVSSGQSSSRKKTEEELDPEYDSKEEGRQNVKDSKTKPPRALIDALGEKGVDAAELLKRCEDLQMLRSHIQTFEPDTKFRLRRVIKPPSYNVRWRPQNDAMLLVGVYRHGFGNWTQIAQDKELGLADKMNVAGNSECKPGAPDTTKLTRRVQTVMKELEREVRPPKNSKTVRKREKPKPEAKPVEKKKSPRGPQKRIAKGRKNAANTKHSRAKDEVVKKASKATHTNRSLKSMQHNLKSMHIDTLKELRALSREKNTLDNAEKISRTKQCLLKLGGAIDKQTESARSKRELWKFVHEVCHTSLAEDRLQGIYEKLAVTAGDGRGESSHP